MTYQTRLMTGLAMVFAFYVASNFATAYLVPQVYGIGCNVDFLSVRCDFGKDVVEPMSAYWLLGGLVGATMLFLHLFKRQSVLYPFMMLFGILAMSVVLLDATSLRPVINSAKIINDTVNILGSVIAASFFLLLVILRHQRYPLLGLARAGIGSYTIKVLSVTAFVAVREGVFGATELFLLYVVYAFGAFSLHLMTVCGFIAKTAAREEAFA